MSAPTSFLRWADDSLWVFDEGSFNGVGVKVAGRKLQQFWVVGDDESDITIAKDVSPDGLLRGRWRDVE